MSKRPPSASRLRKIRLVLMDVDGVMTDGSLYYTQRGEEGKVFNVKDGFGIVKARTAGLMFGIITGKVSAVVRHRARVLGIREVYQGIWDKEKIYDRLLKKMKLTDGEVAYIGDDEPDLPVLRRVGFSASPSDAMPVVKRAVSYVCSLPGGRGAIREVIDLILKAQGVKGR